MEFIVSDNSKTKTLAEAFMLSAYEACEGIQPVHKISIYNILQYCVISQQDNFLLISTDYIYDRMMNTSIAFNSTEGVVKITDRQPTPYYQGWASGTPSDPGVLRNFQQNSQNTKFNTYLELLQYSANRVGVELTQVATATV